MKIYNRGQGRVISLWNADDKVDSAGQPVKPLTKYVLEPRAPTPDLPPTLAQYLLKNYKKKFTADKKAMDAELAMRRKFEEANQKVADHENHLLKIKSLILAAGDTKNKKAAQAAAEELDTLLAQGPRPAAPAPIQAPADPTPTITSPKEEESAPPPAKDDFESKG